ncbi:hypothetical protein HN018_12005 [Lichenicola cladoniae]|uniref:Copper chaperone PCu(A)C n=1 Tax=Lichenicola cladoniae TaxID=1484109 RepID=A0A6M8HR10_9PROT|nr:hypothetical protein [Lichenicola cladoniae]NPD68088.1 hypothetical protein [Acetobacteraceae bacterium]QKE90661.1 hypothetical protein HN018_12005 [Lichenicola cladoniae]
MNSSRGFTAVTVLFMALAGIGSARAVSQVSGPVQIGPSWGQGDPAHSAAMLNTRIINLGGSPDRLIRVECPAIGRVALRNGTLHGDIQAPTLSQQQAAQARQQDPDTSHTPQNGLDLPPSLHGKSQPVMAQFDLTSATQPMTDGALVPCSLYFAHAGQRIVIFTVGENPAPTDEP